MSVNGMIRFDLNV